MVTAVAEKKPGLRKSLFSVAGGNNSKFVQVLMSPCKRAPAKQSLRKGGGANGLKGRVRMSDAVSSMQLDVSGRQAKDLAHV
ncbi:hypothetical protein F2Q68_00004306 [Brassica cretica]|uniref:Uncharacterized protein n=1 Tax=Brassica cretica TaxID=69181 RepID=A0A8S9JFA9_BRACR|nr:hypothetical protein F2Q68_00004306 [Brassica cretica]